jgi:hypothetical protein
MESPPGVLWTPTFAPPAPAKFHRASPSYKAELLLTRLRDTAQVAGETTSQVHKNMNTRSPALPASGRRTSWELEGSNLRKGNENLSGNHEGEGALNLFGGSISVEITSLFTTSVPEPEPRRKEKSKKQKPLLPNEESMMKFLKKTNTPISSETAANSQSQSQHSSQSSTQSSRPAATLVPSPEDFRGIDAFCGFLRDEEAIVERCVKNEVVAIVFSWTDGTSTHSVTSSKLCTPSKPCGSWNCICDRNLRSQLTLTPPLGALLLLGNDPTNPYYLSLGAKGH